MVPRAKIQLLEWKKPCFGQNRQVLPPLGGLQGSLGAPSGSLEGLQGSPWWPSSSPGRGLQAYLGELPAPHGALQGFLDGLSAPLGGLSGSLGALPAPPGTVPMRPGKWFCAHVGHSPMLWFRRPDRNGAFHEAQRPTKKPGRRIASPARRGGARGVRGRAEVIVVPDRP